jgi:hypothetical protein
MLMAVVPSVRSVLSTGDLVAGHPKCQRNWEILMSGACLGNPYRDDARRRVSIMHSSGTATDSCPTKAYARLIR